MGGFIPMQRMTVKEVLRERPDHVEFVRPGVWPYIPDKIDGPFTARCAMGQQRGLLQALSTC